MSSRQLRKLQRQRELEQEKLRSEPEKVEEEEEEEEEEITPTAKPSAFAALLQQDEDQEEDEDEPEEIVEEIQKPVPPKSKSKKKKKKGKAKNQPETHTEPSKPSNGPDEIDAALQALNLKSPTTNSAQDASNSRKNAEYDKSCALIGINTQHLKVANEMRNLFGRAAVGNHDNAGGAVPRAGRRAQRENEGWDLETALKGHHPPGKGLPEITIRRNPFIQGKDEWPKAPTGGLTMSVVDDMQHVDGTIEFKFQHSELYEKVQQQFYMCVQMGDPGNLIALLQRNPYNISLLLQVSKIAKDQGDHALSSDLIERALFTFGRASISSFVTKLQAGKARLDFARPENRELWLAGYHYIKSLMMKGTYRTALEWAKLLFALSPEEDHYCMKLMIHNLAVRSFENEWLLNASDTRAFEIVSTYSTPSLALAAMQAKDTVRSKNILTSSIRRFPFLFSELFKELNIDLRPPSIWGVLSPLEKAENLFTQLYIRQTKDIWNTPSATSLLKEVATAAPKLYNFTRPEIPISLDEARYVYLDGTRELMTLLPKDLLYREPNSDSDPLPPSLKENIFSHPSQSLPFRTAAEGRERGGMPLERQANIMQAIMDLIPAWRGRGNGNPEDGEAAEDEAEEDGEDDPERMDMARLVGALIEDSEGGAGEFRQLFNQIPGAFPGGEGESEGQDEGSRNEAGNEQPGGGGTPREGRGPNSNVRAASFFDLLERLFGASLPEDEYETTDDEEEDGDDDDDEIPDLI